MKTIEKVINRLDQNQLKEARKGLSMVKAILPVISSTSRLYGKDIVEEVDRFFQNPSTYNLIQTAISDFIAQIKGTENTVAKGIFLSVVSDRLNVACIHISEDSIVNISQVEIDGQAINAMSFYELINYLGVDKINLRQMLSDTDTLIKKRMDELKTEGK